MKRLLPLLIAFAALYWWTLNPSVSVSSGDGSVTYVVEYAAGGGSSDRLPMLVALHGNGDTPENFYASGLRNLREPARVILLQGPMSHAGGGAWPWTHETLLFHRDAISEAVTKLSNKFPTRGKPVLLGFSGGASMSNDQALTHAAQYSHIFPVSGSLLMFQGMAPTEPASAEVSAFHGRTDRVIPFAEGEIATKLLKQHGLQASMTPFEGGHLGFFGAQNQAILERVAQALRNLQQQ